MNYTDIMSLPLLNTKLFIPRTRIHTVIRTRLIQRLDEGLGDTGGFSRSLTLISASAGFGKTTLAAHWASECINRGIPVAWLSLDKKDNDLHRFILYLIKALQTIFDAFGEGIEETLPSQELQSFESTLTNIVNQITDLPKKFILVLDDYQAIELLEINDAVAFLIDHLPPQIHLVILTREDPNLPFSRLRSRGQLMELRASDLQFSMAETTDFFSHVLNLDLSTDLIKALKARTEGWITGLQMAILSMQGRSDIYEFVQAFTGSHRFILDYLVDEVLNNQSIDVRNFLLRTSILERFNGSLCNAVTRRSDGKEMLEVLDRANLFIVQLDDVRQWYRFHHLFADVLQTHLKDNFPDLVTDLHKAASDWYEKNGFTTDAVSHALEIADFEHVAAMAEREWKSMDQNFQIAFWLDWVNKLPEEILRVRPVLTIQLASVLSDLGDLEASEKRLREAERWIEITPGDQQTVVQHNGVIVVEEEMFHCLPGNIALLRAGNAQTCGDVLQTLKYAELALRLLPKSDIVGRAQAAVSVGFTHWISGNLNAAAEALYIWINSMHEAGNVIFAIASTFPLAYILSAQGRLREAVRIYEKSLQFASAQPEDSRNILAYMYLGVAMLHHEMGNGESFKKFMKMAEEAGPENTLLNWSYRWNLAWAKVKESEEDFTAALDFLDKAERLYVRDPIPITRPVEAIKTRISIKDGRLGRALDWVQKQNLSADDELSYLKDYEYITLGRVLIEQYKNNSNENTILAAVDLLLRLKQSAENNQWNGDLIEILILLALAYQTKGDLPRALKWIETALTLAAPEEYCRIFLDEGFMIRKLLQLALPKSSVPRYIQKLLNSRGTDKDLEVSGTLAEPLSKREIEVLRMLDTEYNGPEIADKLFISLNTLRTHTKSIYSKLGITNRRAAVRRAKELGLN